MKKKVGPIIFKYDRSKSLNIKQVFIVMVVGLTVYYIFLHGILGITVMNVVISIIISLIPVIGIKRWFLYQNAKDNLEKIESTL